MSTLSSKCCHLQYQMASFDKEVLPTSNGGESIRICAIKKPQGRTVMDCGLNTGTCADLCLCDLCGLLSKQFVPCFFMVYTCYSHFLQSLVLSWSRSEEGIENWESSRIKNWMFQYIHVSNIIKCFSDHDQLERWTESTVSPTIIRFYQFPFLAKVRKQVRWLFVLELECIHSCLLRPGYSCPHTSVIQSQLWVWLNTKYFWVRGWV